MPFLGSSVVFVGIVGYQVCDQAVDSASNTMLAVGRHDGIASGCLPQQQAKIPGL